MKGADRRARRPGAVALALLVGATAAALALTLYYHLGVPGVVAVVVAFLIALPALYLGWVPLKGARQPPDRNLAQIADELAARLRSQWADEAEARGLNDPYPLPVSWTAADPPLAGDLDALKTLATSGAGWSARGRKNWAKGPEDLAGGGDRKLADVLAAVPTGRLVLLGEPGAGKTMLMVGLVLDLLARRRRGDPIPVLATLASWDPVSLGLHAWLGATLITSYPALAAAAPPGSAGGNRFEALVEARLILPVLDGLDEVPEPARPRAITRINQELKPGEQVVVTCRTEEYRAAVSPQDSQGAALRAAAVQLSTLQFGEVARYLRTDADPGADRWDFLDTLSAESPARQALATPLMAGLARAIYNPRPGEHAGKLQDPSELRGLADRPAVEAHLFDEFIHASYRSPTRDRWTAEQAEKWLVFLAHHLKYAIGSPDLAWWELYKAAPRSALRLASGLVIGLVIGLASGLVGGLVGGLLIGVVAGLVGGLVGGLAVAVVAGLVGDVEVIDPSKWTAARTARTASPQAVLARDRQEALLYMPLYGLRYGFGEGLLGGFVSAVVAGYWVSFWVGFWVGLTHGFVGAAAVNSMKETAWPTYMLTRGWLALHHRLPWLLMSFLADAHRRGVLRQAGPLYQFRHIELQQRLATRL